MKRSTLRGDALPSAAAAHWHVFTQQGGRGTEGAKKTEAKLEVAVGHVDDARAVPTIECPPVPCPRDAQRSGWVHGITGAA
jgi:hypothetical protein